MVKPLAFKGDKKISKKRKREHAANEASQSDSRELALNPSHEPENEDEAWVTAEAISDIAGPVLLVLPSHPITCVATDSMGKVHDSPVENMFEDEPATAEPHLVSQVWIATRITGSEDKFTFKGHHGRYLGCDKIGHFSAQREAVSPEETFTVSITADALGVFDLQTIRGKFLSVDESTSVRQIRGDADEASTTTHIRVRMQSRFKPQDKIDKAERVRSKISRKELEAEVGRRLDDDEVKKLKKARKEGNYHETMLDVKVKGKHDKYA